MQSDLYRARACVATAQRLATVDHLSPDAPAPGDSTDALDRLDAALHLAGLDLDAATEATGEARTAHVLRALASLETAASQLGGVQPRRLPEAGACTDALDRLAAAVEGARVVLAQVSDALLCVEA